MLRVQPYKLYNENYMIPSTQITETKISAFIAFPVFKLLSRRILVINGKDNRNCEKKRPLFKKIANFTGKLLQSINS